MIARIVVLPAVMAVLVLGGCGQSKKWSDYHPKEPQARKALETALNAWKNDQPMTRITGVKPAVDVQDFQWGDGEKLADFEVLKNEGGSEGPQWYEVKLTLKDSGKEETVKYAVFGIDPLMVYREEDYNKLSGK